MTVGTVEKSFIDLQPFGLQMAREILNDRSNILPPVNAQFIEVSNIVMDLFNHHRVYQRSVTSNEHELPDGKTRLIYLGMMLSLKKYHFLWPHLAFNNPEELQADDQFRFFRLVLNKYKIFKDGEYKLKTRIGKMDGLPVAYATHTHADLENFMISYFSNSPSEAFSLAVGHDLNEEGLRISSNGENMEVDPRYLIDKFKKDNLGLKLAVGIPTLTESKKEALKIALEADLVRIYRNSESVKNLLRELISICSDSKDKILGTVYHSPMEYGGLALQIKMVVEKLESETDLQETKSHLSVDEIKLLAKGIIEVELADRMSEMADLERFVVNKSNSPRFARIKTILSSCKMLNMYEKLSESVRLLGEDDYFYPALSGYMNTLEVKLLEVNKMLDKLGEQPVSDDELVKFYCTKFKPVQEQADIVMAKFIDDKTNSILEPLYK